MFQNESYYVQFSMNMIHIEISAGQEKWICMI